MAKKQTLPPLSHLASSGRLDSEALPDIARSIQKGFHDIEDNLHALRESRVNSISRQEITERVSRLSQSINEMQKAKLPSEVKGSLKSLGMDAKALAASLAEETGVAFESKLEAATETMESLRAFAARIPEVAALLDIVDEHPLQPPPELPKIVEPSKFKVQDVRRVRPEAPWTVPNLGGRGEALIYREEEGGTVQVSEERLGKVRVRLRSTKGEAGSGIPFSIVAQEEEGGRDVVLGRGLTNKEGYASVDLSHVRREGVGRLLIDVEADAKGATGDDGDEVLRIDITDAHLREYRDLGIPHMIRFDLDRWLFPKGRSHGVPDTVSIESPDAKDAENSPESFGFATQKVDGTCRILPRPEMSVREYFFRQLVRIDDPELAGSRDNIKRQDVTAPIPFGAEGAQAYDPQGGNIQLGKSVLYKVGWRPVQQGLGQLLYSLALAPCEAVNLAVIDWSRTERQTRSESTSLSERVEHELHRDSLIDDIVEGTLYESVSGGSTSDQEASAGSGFNWGAALAGTLIGGPLLGAAAGTFFGDSSTSGTVSVDATTTGYRDLVTSATRAVSDSIVQRASAHRSLRSTIVTTSYERESERIRTRVVRNHNRNHAMTVHYYQVLQHYNVVTEVHEEQDVLLVPYKIDNDIFTPLPSFNKFTAQPSWTITRFLLRNERILRRMVPREYGPAFDALNRLVHCRHLYQEETPVATCSRWRVNLDSGWRPGVNLFIETEDESFPLYPRGTKNVTIFDSDPVDLSEIAALRISYDRSQDLELQQRQQELDEVPNIPGRGRTVVDFAYHHRHGELHARTNRSRFVQTPLNFRIPVAPNTGALGGVIVGGESIKLDQTNPSASLPLTPPNLESAFTGYRGRMHRDYCTLKRLVAHVQQDPMRYLRSIWLAENPDRRILRFDRYIFQGRSLAGQIQNRPLGVVGNYVAFPLLDGHRLMPQIQPAEAVAKRVVSVPTRGVHAEVFLSSCNATETRDITRAMDEKSACVAEAPQITGITPGSRQSTQQLTPTGFAAPIVNIQSPPALPSSDNMAAGTGVLSTPGIFPDLSFGAQTIKAAQVLAQQALVTHGERQQAIISALTDLLKTGAAMAATAATGVPVGTGGGGSGTPVGAIVPGGTDVSDAVNAAQGAVSGAIGAAAGSAVRASDPVRTYDQLQNIENAHRSGGLTEEGRRTATSNLLGDTSAATPAMLRTSTPVPVSPGSALQDAIRHIAAFEQDTRHAGWKLTRSEVADGLRDLVNNPNGIDQDHLNLCGPAAFVRAWARRDPLAVARLGTDLYQEGKGIIGTSLPVEPSQRLIDADYTAIRTEYDSRPGNNSFMNNASSWMVLSSLRNSENIFPRFDGTAESQVSGITTPREIEKWMRASGLYHTVRNEANIFFQKGLAHLYSLRPDSDTDVLVFMNAQLIAVMRDPSQGIKDKAEYWFVPNHIVSLEQPAIPGPTSNESTVNFWTWGLFATGAVSNDAIEQNYWGAVIGERGGATTLL
jgi:hypothetical protein